MTVKATNKPKAIIKNKPALVEIVPPKISLPPTTTDQEDIVTAGQRRINLIWEITQAAVAVLITLATIYCAIKSIDARPLGNAFFLIVSMYFVRTNHKLIGGVGYKNSEQTR